MSKLKLLFAATVALVAFAALTSSAGAFSARVAAGGNISSPSLGRITFGSSPTIQCNLTLNGSLRTSASIAVNETLGSITEVRIASCTGGSVERVLSLPWPLTVRAIPSGLPDSATSLEVNIVRSSFNLSTFFELVNCLYSGNSAGIIEMADTGTNTYTTGLVRANETVRIGFVRGSEACPSTGEFRGRFALNATQSITVS